MRYYLLKAFLLFIVSISLINGCAKSRVEKELKVSDNNISIRIEGAVYPIQRQNILASTSGKIKHLYIKYGDKITRGERIYSLDKELIKLDIQNKKTEIASLTQIKHHLFSNIHATSNTQSINLAAMELKKMAQLKAEGYVQDFEQNTYKKNYINVLNSQTAQNATHYEKLKTVESSLHTKKIQLQKLQYRLKHADGYASINGFVADIQVQEGQTISSDTKVCTIVNLDKVILKAGFATGLLPFLHVNQMVNISFVTTPPYSVQAPIAQITPIVDPKFKSMTFTVVIPNKHYILQEGTRALVTIQLPKKGQERVKKYFMNNKNDRVIQIQSNI